MAKVFIEETTLTNIGNAIRDKEGTSELIPVTDMATRIAAIESGGGGAEPPESAFNITGDCMYRFAEGGWDWFINMYGDRVTTSNIGNCMYMFARTQVEEIPFTVNISSSCDNFQSMFVNAKNLKVCPKIRGRFNGYYLTSLNCESMLEYCYNIRDFEDLFTDDYTDAFSSVVVTSEYSVPRPPKFKNCYSMRQVPSWFYKFGISPESSCYPYYYYAPIRDCFNFCYALDEIIDLPVLRVEGKELTQDMFNSAFGECYRLQNLTFETDNGTPYTVRWKNQVINLSYYTGYGYSVSNVTSYNSGITADQEARNWESYNRVKNDDGWFSTNHEYSRYNYPSAIATINSLPDASAYLAESGGTNTIKFKADLRCGTDQGGVNALTPEEIGIAAAKGWTVTFV